jgi:WD40 repeat protein/DNA-binding SARP family transcriptional activator/energy-coupling factor transporter ATP-binding protein EcfA2
VGVSVLGPLILDGDAALGPRDRVVLAALVAHRGRSLSPEQLAEALWGDSPPTSWTKIVQGCVVRLRKRIGSAAIETTPGGYRLLAGIDVDAGRFEQLVGRGRELVAVGEPERAAHVFAEALSLWRGPSLLELGEWPPGRIESDRLEDLRLTVEEAYLDAALAAGRHREVLSQARARVAEAPLREHRWALLARAQYQCGHQGDALRSLTQARDVLREELGVDLGHELVALEQALLRQDDSLTVVEVSADAGSRCPYLGLVAYDVDDAETFFGRDAVVVDCLRRLSEGGALTVVGPSGSGKSSLLRAGVAASLRRSGRDVVLVTPGPAPMESLTAVPVAAHTVLIVDQCEEAVTLCADVDEQDRFFAALAAHAAVAPLVVAVRADHLGNVTTRGTFARIVERSLHLLGPMDGVDLRAAIEGPARQAGLLLEPGLVDLLVREVEGEPGALPLLSHVLHQTWQRREGRTLTVDGYRASGGIREAVGRSAEEVYERIAPERRPVLRDLMLRLVTATPEGEPVRNRVPRALVGDDPSRLELVELLVSSRLLTSDDGTIELAHESLVRTWPRFREWLDDDVEGQRILRHLTAAAISWDAMGRPDSELYRGGRLTVAADWRHRASPALAPVESLFLDASNAREAADLNAANAQIIEERRTIRRLRALVGAIAATAVLAAAASAVAFDQRGRAGERATIAEARRIAAGALVEPSYDRALLHAVEAVHLWDSPEMRGNLATTIERSPGALAVIRSAGPRLLELQLSPDGRHAAVSDSTDDVVLYDLDRRRAVSEIGSDRGQSYRMPVFSPDGRHVAVSMFATSCWLSECPDFAVELRAVDDLEAVERYDGLGLPAAGIAFSADGTLMAAAQPFEFGTTENIAVWRVGEPHAPAARLALAHRGADLRPTPDSGPPGWVAFSPDGSTLYASGAGPAVAFDLATGAPLRTFDGLGALALSPDGAAIAIRTSLTEVGLFDTSTGRLLAELVGHHGTITAAAFSADTELVATASNDGSAAVWAVPSGVRQQVLEGHAGSVLGVAFAEDGALLHTSSADRSLMTWDLDRSHGLVRQVAPPRLPDILRGVVVAAGGERAAFMEDVLHVLDPEHRSIVEIPIALHSVLWATYLPHGRTLATVGVTGEVRLIDARTGETLARADGRGELNHGAIAASPGGRTLVVADADGVVTELDARSLKPTGRSLATDIETHSISASHGGVVALTSSERTSERGSAVVFADLDDGRILHRTTYSSWGSRTAFSPDGTRYALGAVDGRLQITDVRTGEVTGGREPVHDGASAWVTFSPDGRTVASLGSDGEVVLADAATGAVRARMRPRQRTASAGAMEFRADGHTLVIAYGDGSMHSYDTAPDAWMAHACAVAGRDLTAEEWAATFGRRPYRPTCTSTTR